jgi:hypothetical protein
MTTAASRKPASDVFEVILCFENNSWLFSTYAEGQRPEKAVEKAEDEFIIHSTLHELRYAKPTSAYVLSGVGNRFFSKRNGKWQTAAVAACPLPPAARDIVFPPVAEAEAARPSMTH